MADKTELAFPFVIFEEVTRKQQLWNQIGDYYRKLELKAEDLIKTSRTAGEELYKVVSELRTITMDAAYSTNDA